MRLCSAATIAVLALFSGFVWAAPPSKPSPLNYNTDVRPILAKNCFACHGPDDEHREAGLRLDHRDVATAQLESGEIAIIPGQPDKSELLRRITSGEEETRMPPKSAGDPLSPEQIETIRRWISQGAGFDEHWSFVKPHRSPLPTVKDSTWPQSRLDFFIQGRREQAELTGTPEADRYALIRRLSLDLRGLPPTPPEVSEFAADKNADAFDRMQDRFLADPAYGERWARIWLDLARYADSRGYGSDPLRNNMWRYRDWVIGAFNQNIRYDQFTVEQIAGDLLPSATLDQRIATAFHRNTMTNTEGGTDDEEFRTAAVKDRVDTTFQVWMGLTYGCAKCHNHKYDPISQRDYYQFYAIFNQTSDADRGDDSPFIPAPSPNSLADTERIDSQIAELAKSADTPSSQLAEEQKKWEAELRLSSGWTPVEVAEFRATSGATTKKLDDGSLLIEGSTAATDTYTVLSTSSLPRITAFRLETIPDDSLPSGGAGRAADGNFVLSRFAVTAEPLSTTTPARSGQLVRIELPGENKLLSLAEVQVFSDGQSIALQGKASQSSTDYEGDAKRAIDNNTNGNYFETLSTTHTKSEKDPWWEVDLGETKPIERIAIWNRTDGGTGSRLANFRVLILDEKRQEIWRHEVSEPPSPSRELAIAGPQSVSLANASADFSQASFPVGNALKQKDLAASGWSVGPEQGKPHAAVFAAAAGIADESGTRLTFELVQSFNQPNYTLGRFRLSVTNDPAALGRQSVPPGILKLVDVPEAARTPEQRDELARHFRTVAPSLTTLREQIAKLEKSKPAVPTVPIMEELAGDRRRLSHIMVKGDFLTKGDVVPAALPSSFHPARVVGEVSRLDAAHWIIDVENPLTARVAVNRFWAQLFGAGFVETEEDFGTQGTLPTHPELLDDLAVEFQHNWDVKRLLRHLTASATYRQSARVTPATLNQDPRNQLYTRGPRFRLEAEIVRDQALALSGLLSRKIYGPSVYPFQPDGLWRAAFNGERSWTTSTGEDRYRRGLYTFWRRTIPYPSMATFDAPSRESCTVRRIRTNTPLQAFVTLNDPAFVEAAQALGRRIIQEGGPVTAERIAFGLSLCLSRPPTPDQIQQLTVLFESELTNFRENPDLAKQMATEPLGPVPSNIDVNEAAAWTVVANVLLNLDGVLAK